MGAQKWAGEPIEAKERKQGQGLPVLCWKRGCVHTRECVHNLIEANEQLQCWAPLKTCEIRRHVSMGLLRLDKLECKPECQEWERSEHHSKASHRASQSAWLAASGPVIKEVAALLTHLAQRTLEAIGAVIWPNTSETS